MKRLVVLHIVSLLLVWRVGHAQAPLSFVSSKVLVIPENGTIQSNIQDLFLTDNALNPVHKDQAIQEVEDLIKTVRAKSGKKAEDERIIKLVFDQARKKFFQSYDTHYPYFCQLFMEGRYNCLTGTALYAWVLERLGYAVNIHETAFHAYLTIRTDQNVFLVDATDPQNGLVSGAAAVGKRELWYAGNELKHGTTFNRIITFQQLIGLQYFNQGVVAFNERDYTKSLCNLEKALLFYPGANRIVKLKEAAIQNQKGMVAFSSRAVITASQRDLSPE